MNENTSGTRLVVGLAALCVFLAACSAFRGYKKAKADRGVVVNHALHAQEGIDCMDCHEIAAGQPAPIPNHDTCSICHNIPEEASADTSCNLCHTRPDYTVLPRPAVLTEEIKFDHAAHAAAQVSCAECHPDPDKGALQTPRLKPLCMDCHSNLDAPFAAAGDSDVADSALRANECAVCHRSLSVDTIPQTRAGVRIPHDSPQIWKRIHGSESHVDPAFCAQCHDAEDHCAACHAIEKPASHTPAWNRKMHGLQATWDPQRCAVCHEEDSCIKCHRSAQPASHRGGFHSPQNTHCVQCHFPPENNCAVCHEAINHRSTPPTPHDAGGGFAGNCALCHPGGVAGASPHLTNMTVSCTFCHQ